MPFTILSAIQWLGAGFWAFASSRMGQITIAAVVAWFWAGARADDHWRAVIAADKAQAEAAYRAEVARQEQAARAIAAGTRQRDEDSAALARLQSDQIADFNRQESQNVPPPRTVKQIIFRERAAPSSRPCVIDSDFTGVVRRLDATALRPAKPADAARKSR